MNQISISLYLADLLGNVQPVCVILAFIFFVASIIAFAIHYTGVYDEFDNLSEKTERFKYWAAHPESRYHYNNSDSIKDTLDKLDLSYRFRTLGRLLVTAFFACLIIGVAIPSKNTIYMIAASQVGQQIMETPTGDQVNQIATDSLKLIQKYLTQQLGESK